MEVQQQKKITEIFNTIGWKRQNAERLVIEENEQRGYEWGTQQFKELMEDIEEQIASKSPKEIYLSTFLSHQEANSPFTKIFDGNQRLTTILILLIALRDYIKHNFEENLYYNDIIRRIEECIFNSNNECIMILQNEDNNCLTDILNNSDSVFKSGYMFKNNLVNKMYRNCYNYIHMRTEQCPDYPFLLFTKGIENVVMAEERATTKNEARRLFGRKNASGINVAKGNVISSFICGLIDLYTDSRDEFIHVKTKFDGAMSRIPSKEYTDFYRLFLYYLKDTYLTPSQTQKEIEKITKSALKGTEKNDHFSNISELIDCIDRFSKFMSEVSHKRLSEFAPSHKINRLLSLTPDEITITITMIDLFTDKYSNYNIDNEDKYQILNGVMKIIVRRMFAPNSTNHSEKTMLNVMGNILTLNGCNEHLYQTFKRYMSGETNKALCYGYLTESDLIERVSKIPVYRRLGSRMQVLKYLFHNLNKYVNSGIEQYVYTDFNDMTIEHIKSQNEFSSKDLLQHTIGNLTPLTRNNNSRCKNRPFNDKKAVYLNSGIKLTESVGSKAYFNNEEIVNRSNELAPLIMEITRL